MAGSSHGLPETFRLDVADTDEAGPLQIRDNDDGQRDPPYGETPEDSGTSGVANTEPIPGVQELGCQVVVPTRSQFLEVGCQVVPTRSQLREMDCQVGPTQSQFREVDRQVSGANIGPIPGGGLRAELSDSVVPGGGQSDHVRFYGNS